MSNYTAGSVSAKVELDTSQFKEAIQSLKKDVESIQSIFNSIKGVSKFEQEIKDLKEQMKSLQQTNEDYRNQLKKLREESNNLTKASKKTSNQLKKETEETSKYNEALVKVTESQRLFRENYTSIKGGTYLGKQITEFNKIAESADKAAASTKRFATETGKAVEESIRLRNANGEKNYWGGKKAAEGMKADLFFNADWEQVGYEIGRKALKDFLKQVSEAKIQVKRDSVEIENAIRRFAQFEWKGSIGTKFDNFGKSLLNVANNAKKANEALSNLPKAITGSTFEQFVGLADKVNTGLRNIAPSAREAKQAFDQLKSSVTGFAPVVEKTFVAATEGAEKFKQRLAEIAAQTKLTFESMQVELAKANAAQYKYWQQVRGQSSRVQTVSKIGDETIKWATTSFNKDPLSIKGYNDYLKAANAVSKYNEQIEKNIALERKRRSALAAKDSIAYSYENFSKASAGMSLLNNQMDTYTRNAYKSNSETTKFSQNVRNSGKGITTFNNGIVQTAHSGRILSNTLYQIRGALLSLKMIATAMGGMMLWGFAMEIAEGVKTTFTAKNEMEAQLKQNAKVGQNGLRDFNKELDNTIAKFKKVNKYQLGETVSSLGVEFELSMKQMKKAMPIVAMIQSEYVRAGRTSEEAALAVKDILQGEFQRLSRETGVGKDELTKYGWSGDKTDLDSLLDAVKKAGEDRHWDIFAAKATSLNDVVQMTKSRFEEFGADLLQSISPMVVGAFNTLVDSINGLQNAFNSLGTFDRNFLVGGTFIGGITAILTLLPMVTKGMGLAEIATLGWGKSVGTALLNLNKAEVSLYGFRKALAAVISGTSAAELAETRWSKAIVGRILGLNQGTLAQKGYLTALVKSRMEMTTIGPVMSDASIASMKWYQKLGYLGGRLKESEMASASFGKSMKSLITSTRLWGVALKGLIGIGIVAWFATLATWADTVKKRMESYNDFIDNGTEKVESAQKTLDNYNKKLGEMKDTDPDYALTKSNRDTAQHNLASITAANKLAQSIKKNSEDVAEANNLMLKRGLNDIYSANGLKNIEKYGEEYQQMKYVAYDIAKSEEESKKFRYASLQHIKEHTDLMAKGGIAEEQRIKYITEYNAKAQEAADNLKKFNQGDITAGAYFVLNRLQLMWIDLWNDKDFINFWNAAKKTFEDIKPTLIWLGNTIEGIGRTLMRFFSTEQGRWVGALTGAGIAVGLLTYKFRESLSTLWDFGKAIVNRIKDLKNLKKASEETSDVLGGDKSTGGIKGKTPTKYEDWGEVRGAMKQDVMANARSFANNATKIAMAMGYLTVAIVTLSGPMLALALEGELFKRIEPQVRKGIEGLKLIAPTIIAFLVPSMALMAVMSKYKISSAQMTEGFKTSAQGIALGIVLVTEALVLLNAPLISLGILGSVYSGLGNSVEQGIKAIKITTDALYALVPWVPVFVAGIALAAITFGTGGVGGIAIGVVAAGIAVGVLAVAEAIAVMQAPLKAIEQIGNSYPNLSGVEQGAKALKVNAEALGYVDSALTDLVHIQWEDIKSRAMSLTGISLDTSLNDLVKEGGFFTQLNTFMTNLNNLNIVSPVQEKIDALNKVADGIGTIDEAIKNVKSAMENLPNEFKNGGSGTPALSYDNATGKTSVTGSASDDPSGYFEQFKAPLKELKSFIDDFNNSDEFDFQPPDTGRIEAISQSADMVTQINEAVSKVKDAMGNIAMGNIATNFAQATGGGIPAFGGLGAIGGLIESATGGGQGDYQSSLGSQLYEMEMVIKDLNTFNSNISGISAGSSDGGNAQALSETVTIVSDAITKLNDTLAQAVPNIKQNATNIGTGIKEGIKTGMGSLAGLIVTPLVAELGKAKANAATYGKGIGWALSSNYKSELKIKSATETEISGTLTYLEGKKQDFYNKGHDLGDSLSKGYKDGQKMHSPGIIARSTEEELGRVGTYFDEAIFALPQKAVELGENISSNFNPQLAMGGLSVDELGEFQTGLDTISSMSSTTSLQTSTDFTNMSTSVSSNMANISTNVGGTFNTINQNATTSYAQLTNTTRTALNNMQSQTTKNIQGIKSSWRDMQTALIQSAENIRSETGNKIRALESNMASFWNKVQNPANLLGGAGNPFAAQHSIRRRTSPVKSSIGFAGSGTNMGISSRFKSQKSKTDPSIFAKLFEIIGSDFPMYAGGWSFNWSDDIRRTLLQWRTHFGEIYDNHLTVGKFENDDFPVRGIAEIAKNYIYDAISRTHYVGYFDSRYGDDPLAAWNAGGFNCWDGTNVVLALASAFGFSGSRVHGSWDGTPHVWARIPGLGDIDATAIQQGYGFTASKVRGAGSVSPAYTNPDSGTTNNYNGDINIHIHTDGNDVEVDDRKIDSETGRKIIDLLGINPSTGR